MFRWGFNVLVGLFLLMLMGCGTEVESGSNSEETTISIYGVVRDSRSGDPIQGAKVTLMANDATVQRSQVTGLDGRYSVFIANGLGVFSMEISAYGHSSSIVDDLMIQKGQTSKEMNFSLTPVSTEYPLDCEFVEPHGFVVKNLTDRYFGSISIVVGEPGYLIDEREYYSISLRKYESDTLDYLSSRIWKDNDRVEVTVDDMVKVWTY